MFKYHLKQQRQDNIDKRNFYIDKITEINKGCFTNVNFDLLQNICNENKNRFTNFYGYWYVSSSYYSKIAVEFFENVCIKHSNHKRASYAITYYLLDENLSHTNLYTLLIDNFDRLFEKN